MERLLINAAEADLPASGPGIRLQYAIRDLQSLASLRADASYTLRLPATRNNQRLLGLPHNLASDSGAPGGFGPLELNAARLYVDGQLVLEGWVRLLAFSAEAYEVQLLGGNAAWAQRLQQRKLADVDADAGGWREARWWHVHSACTVRETAGHTGQATTESFQPLCYPLVAYNHDPFATLPGTPLSMQHLRPAAFVAPLLFAHFRDIGFELKSEWLSGFANGKTPGHPLAIPFGLKDWHIARELDETTPILRIHTTQNGSANGRFLNPAHFGGVEADVYSDVVAFAFAHTSAAPNGFGQGSVQTWVPSKPGWYRISGVVRAFGPNPNSLAFSLRHTSPNGQVFSTLLLSGMSLKNAYAEGAFDEEVFIAPEFVSAGFGVLLLITALTIDAYPVVGCLLEARPLNRVAEGTSFDLRATLPSLTVMELLHALTAQFHLHFRTDPKQRLVYMEPRETFLETDGPTLDAHLDTLAPIEQSMLAASLPAQFVFKYAQPRNDVNLQALADAAPEGSPGYGGTLVQNPAAALATGAQTVEVRKLSPSLNRRLGPLQVDALWFEDSDFPGFRTQQSARIVAVRQAQSLSPIPILSKWAENQCPGGPVAQNQVVGLETYACAYFDTFGHTLSFADTETAIGLISQYYRTYLLNLTTARKLACTLSPKRLPLAQLKQFNTYVRLLGQRMQPTAIRNHAPGQPTALVLEAITAASPRTGPEPRFKLGHGLRTAAGRSAATATLPAAWGAHLPLLWAAWVKVAQLAPAEANVLAWHSGSQGLRLRLDALGHWVWQGTGAGNTTQSIKSLAPIVYNAWMHVGAGLLNGNLQLWLDGQPAPTQVLQAGPLGGLAHQAPMRVGSEAGGHLLAVSEVFWGGRHEAGTHAAHLHNLGAGQMPDSLDAVFIYARFNEMQGTVANNLANGPHSFTLEGYPPAETGPGGSAWITAG